MTTTAPVGRRFVLGVTPTPLVAAHRLADAIGADVWLKRDDLIGFAQAGTKTRALEFLVSDALDGEYDCLVGCGGPSSNFIAALAAAAAVAGLKCHLVLYGRPVPRPHPNLAAARAWGAAVRFTGDPDRETVEAVAAEHCAQLAAHGLRPYLTPRGGATAVGAAGGAKAVAELEGPLGGQPPARIVVAAGSGTTAAGLLVGLAARRWPTVVVAAAVSRPVAETRAVIEKLAEACAQRMGIPRPDPGSLEVVDAIGPGFGIAGRDALQAARLAVRTEGVVLDPTYTAKAFGLLVAGSGAQRWQGGTTVFWHTGGIAGAMAALAAGTDPTGGGDPTGGTDPTRGPDPTGGTDQTRGPDPRGGTDQTAGVDQ